MHEKMVHEKKNQESFHLDKDRKIIVNGSYLREILHITEKN